MNAFLISSSSSCSITVTFGGCFVMCPMHIWPRVSLPLNSTVAKQSHFLRTHSGNNRAAVNNASQGINNWNTPKESRSTSFKKAIFGPFILPNMLKRQSCDIVKKISNFC